MVSAAPAGNEVTQVLSSFLEPSTVSPGSASNSNDLAPMDCLFELLWGVFGE